MSLLASLACPAGFIIGGLELIGPLEANILGPPPLAYPPLAAVIMRRLADPLLSRRIRL